MRVLELLIVFLMVSERCIVGIKASSDKCSGTAELFTCPADGRYDDPNDPTCTKYYICASSITLQLTCPDGSYFDPSLLHCTEYYTCSCNIEANSSSLTTTVGLLTTQTTTPTTSYPTNAAPTPDSSNSSTNTTTSTTTEYITSKQTTILITSGSTTETTTQTPDSNECAADTSTVFSCTQSGRFKNPMDPYCISYIYCYNTSTGNFIKAAYTCPTNTYFNSAIQLCDEDYVCLCNNATESTTAASASSLSTTTESATKTIEPNNCITDNTVFTCTEDGRFKDPANPYCTSYIYCYKLSNGSYVKAKYECSANTYFGSDTQTCEAEYVCPCSNSTTITTIKATTTTATASEDITTTQSTTGFDECVANVTTVFRCTQTGRFKNPSDPYCTSYIYCYNTSTGNFIETKYICPSNSYFNSAIQLCDEDYVCACTNATQSTTVPTTISVSTTTQNTIQTTESSNCIVDNTVYTCSANGRFEDPANPYCTSYIYCYKLSSGSYVKTRYECSANTYFDSDTQTCDAEYVCPCSNSTTIMPTTTTVTASDDIKSTQSTSLNTLSSTTETTTPTPGFDECVPNTTTMFNCTQTGRFKNPADPYCTSYIYCYNTSTENLIKAEYICPSNTYFNSAIQLCDEDYVCPCNNATQSTTVPTTTNVSTTMQNATQTTESNNCIADNTVFTCTANGRFKDPANPFCTSYIYCYKLSSGSYVKTKYECSAGAYFDSDTQTCDEDYVCLCSNSTTITTIQPINTTTTSEGLATTQAISVTNSSTTTKTTTQTPDADECVSNTTTIFICTQTGRFTNPADPYCTSYIYCYNTSSGTLIKTGYTCSTNTYFNSAIQQCDENYICPCNNVTQSTAVATTTSLSTTTQMTAQTTESDNCIVDNSVFTCNANGLFKDPSNPYCTSYIYCYKLSSGSYVKTKYVCSSGTYFDSNTQTCDAEYVCSCTNSTTITTSGPTATTSTTTEYITTTLSTALSTLSSTTESTTKAPDSDECVVNNTAAFDCTQTGRFKDPTEPYCTRYIYCYNTSTGNLIKAQYVCPTNTYFNSALQLCDLGYVCPCNNASQSTTIATTSLSTTTQSTSQTIESNNCIADNSVFTCTTSGRFADPADPYCTSYIYCYKLSSGNYVKTTYICSAGTYFDSDTQTCGAEHVCPCSNLTTVTTSKPTTTTSATTEDIATTKSTILTTENPTTESTTQTSITSLSTTARSTTQTTESNNCIADNGVFTCTESGRFKDPVDPYCTSYIYCFKLSSGNYVKTKYECSAGTYFDSKTQTCGAEYACPCSNTTQNITEVTPSTTTQRTTSTTESDNSLLYILHIDE